MQKKLERVLIKLRNTLLVVIVIFIMIVYRIKKIHYQKVSKEIPNNSLKYVIFEKVKSSSLNFSELRTVVTHLNKNRIIMNGEHFGPILESTPVFVITVNKLSSSLQFSIISLSQIRGIEQVLLVFSHSIYDENVNKLVGSIDFCRVLQIYYPYSLQMYPHEFPGYSLQDCPHGMDMKTAQARNCTGSLFPDIRGQFRNPEKVEQKHHWWWTANVIFESVLSPVMDYDGIVVFIKDDLYLMKDFLYILLFMNKISEDLSICDYLTLDDGNLRFIRSMYGLELSAWNLHYEPSVLAFKLNVWNNIVSNYDLFCDVDDSSWARSLFYISIKQNQGLNFRIMSSMFPRTYKINFCWFAGTENWDVIENVYQILELQKNLNDFLFPMHLEVYIPILEDEDSLTYDDIQGFGGWSDPRDKYMCENVTLSKIKKIVTGLRNVYI